MQSGPVTMYASPADLAVAMITHRYVQIFYGSGDSVLAKVMSMEVESGQVDMFGTFVSWNLTIYVNDKTQKMYYHAGRKTGQVT